MLNEPLWRSLRLRSWVVLVIGLLLMQTLGFGLISYWREQQIRTSMLSFMAKDAALAHTLLQGAAPAEHERWLRRLDRGYYDISVGPLAHPNETMRPGLLPALDAVQARAAEQLQRNDVRWVWRGDIPTLELPIGNGQAVHIEARDPLPSTTLASRLAYGGVLLVTAAGVGWAVVRMLMKPLNRFFNAARAFGEDMQCPLLPVIGPTEVREVAQVFNQMQERIRRQVDERTQIVSAISHDLQTPITRLRLRSDLIENDQLRQKFADDLDAMSAMVREGLDYARSSQLREHRVPIDLTALAESLADQASDMGQEVVVEGRIERPYFGALRSIERALMNLITNAVKFGGQARVVLSEEARGACIRVIDPGPGVPPELLDRLFDPFFRVEPSRSRDHGGTGLGLAIARNLVRAHGGEITVANGEVSGFVATMILPREASA